MFARPLLLVLTAAAILGLAGCGTYRNQIVSSVPAEQRAVLVYKGPMAGVAVSHVDGENRGIGLFDRFELAPGLRTVTAFLNMPGTRSQPMTVEFEAKAGGQYELKYSTTPIPALAGMPGTGGGRWRIWVVDSASGQEVSVRSLFVPKD